MESCGAVEVMSEADVKLDLRGVMCPMNFVKTKLKLEPMDSGDLLEITLDDGEPLQNVPQSLTNEGHTIVEVMSEDGFSRVTVRKR